MSTAHVDLDFVKYAAASAGESRSVKVSHKTSNWTTTVNNRTEWYGHWKKKTGGKLAELNATRPEDRQVKWDDFEYEDIQVPEPIENVLHTARLMVEKAIDESGATDAKFYIGKGDSFRVERSTLLKYKGQRHSSLRPVLLDEVSNYLTNKFKAQVITNIEVDDAVVINSYRKKDHFILGLDKDYLGAGSRFFNVNTPDKGVQETNLFGNLYIDSKGYVKGVGRMFKLFQCCSQDMSDNYAANCFSDVKWGEKSAYNALKDCKDDRELFQASVDVFKTLYPEPKTVVGWRGDEILIDWKYVMQECFDMCHMLRWENDSVNLDVVFNKLGVDIG